MKLLGLLAALALSAAAAQAQEHPIDRAAALVRDGDYTAARALLARWWAETGGGIEDASPELRARALLLRARLAPDLATAENDYLALVLGYPTAPAATEALLRLGQGFLAAGDAARAVSYLERLATDYPRSPERVTGLLWLARAQRVLGHTDEACSAVHAGLDAAPPDVELGPLLRLEAETACQPQMTEPLPPPVPSSEATYAAQSGAFRRASGAENLAGRLREAGFDARLVYVPGDSLLRVRIGRFVTPDEAAALVARLRDAGFDAVVVRDVPDERRRR